METGGNRVESEKARLLYIALQGANTIIIQLHKISSLRKNEQNLKVLKTSHTPNRHSLTETVVPLKANLSAGVN